MSSSRHLVGFAALALSILALSGCAPLGVHAFSDSGADFNRYRTYKFAPSGSASTGDPRLDHNPFFNQRMQADVEKELAARGFEKTRSARPDVLVQYHVSVSQETEIKDTEECRLNDCRPLVYDAGTLMVDFVDPRTNKLIWRGWAEGSMDGVIDNQSWMEQKIDDSVRRIFAKLPRRA
jgi:hypothetical protein